MTKRDEAGQGSASETQSQVKLKPKVKKLPDLSCRVSSLSPNISNITASLSAYLNDLIEASCFSTFLDLPKPDQRGGFAHGVTTGTQNTSLLCHKTVSKLKFHHFKLTHVGNDTFW